MRSIVVSLDEDTTYAVYVRAMSRYGLGRVASVRLSTPRLELPTPASTYPRKLTLISVDFRNTRRSLRARLYTVSKKKRAAAFWL